MQFQGSNTHLERRSDPQPSVRQQSIDVFRRIEDKYFIPKNLQTKLVELLDKNMGNQRTLSSGKASWVESVYFDSEDLDLVNKHFTVDEGRFKLRTRRYSDDGQWPPADHDETGLHLEFKLKTKEKVTKKFRFRITHNHFAALSEGREIKASHTLSRLNAHTAPLKLYKRIEKVNKAIREFHLRPQTAVTYLRRAYEKDGFRITFDDRIDYKPLAPVAPRVVEKIHNSEIWPRLESLSRNYLGREQLVIEAKHEGVVPSWLIDFFTENGIEKVSFSKYCHSVAQSILRREV